MYIRTYFEYILYLHTYVRTCELANHNTILTVRTYLSMHAYSITEFIVVTVYTYVHTQCMRTDIRMYIRTYSIYTQSESANVHYNAFSVVVVYTCCSTPRQDCVQVCHMYYFPHFNRY